ncbi:hypothetical protein ACTNDG_09075 [Clostridium sp. HCP1S3_B4]|uniref:hypothetical protein n=1 Tax=unclassified Clostridium TaxID=2614128 RepID=UPI003F8A6097
MTVSEISREYEIAGSTINGWIKKGREIRINEDEVITVSEIMKLKKEMAMPMELI